jgi:putative Ca2+/H+ antiporter (TMEM165/GDT1 family)
MGTTLGMGAQVRGVVVGLVSGVAVAAVLAAVAGRLFGKPLFKLVEDEVELLGCLLYGILKD